MVELLLYHCHTEESNKTAPNRLEELGLNEEITANHFADYPDFIDSLPNEVNPIIVRTEHCDKYAKDDSRSFHQRFPEEIESRGGQTEYHETHITGYLGENEFTILEGVEGTYNDSDKHIIHAGVPIEEEVNAFKQTSYEFNNMSEDSAFSGIPHWNFLAPSEEEKMEILEESERNEDIDVAISYSSGNGIFDHFLNGKNLEGSTVEDYSEEYGAPLIPELDWHNALPYKLDGVGIVEDGTIEQFQDGEIPTENILDCDMLSYDSKTTKAKGLVYDTWNFGSGMVLPSLNLENNPVNSASKKLFDRYMTPVVEEDYKDLARRNLENATDVYEEEILDNRVSI